MIVPALLFAVTIGVSPQLVAALPRVPLPRPAASAVRATTHGNHVAAGTRAGNLLTVQLDVVSSAWKPEGDDDPEVPVFAFAERGESPNVPGPMLRAPQGTRVQLVLRNLTDSAVVITGLRPRVARGGADTVHLRPGATRELSFRLDTAGTYFYWGAIAGTGFDSRLWLDSQLNGAIIVDSPRDAARMARGERDEVFIFSEWFHPYDDPRQAFEVVSVINGKGWPHTERVTLPLGDSVRFHVLNATPLSHPIHLHGFYYRILARGSYSQDGPLPRALQPLMNTDLLGPGRTLTFAFVPTTPGNWLLHCHFSFHMDETVTLAGSPRDSSASRSGMMSAATTTHPLPSARATAKAGAHAGEHSMRGLVVGIQVPMPPGRPAYNGEGAREIRLLAQRKAGALAGGAPAFGFVAQLGATAPAADSVSIPGSVLELQRGKPVRITVVNNLDEPTGVHWHGLEIESFPDGVAGWSGIEGHRFAPIAPRDSFVAAFTPPRAGTFPYHSHLNERAQILSGMYGAIIVTDTPRDTLRDHLIVAGGGGPDIFAKAESPFALVNGRRFTRPLTLTAGETHRLRIVSVHPDWLVTFTLRNDSAVARWRAVAKDGADLPPAQATRRLATVEMGPGETADFEFRPPAPGRWVMEIRSSDPGWYIPLEIVVRRPSPPGMRTPR